MYFPPSNIQQKPNQYGWIWPVLIGSVAGFLINEVITGLGGPR